MLYIEPIKNRYIPLIQYKEDYSLKDIAYNILYNEYTRSKDKGVSPSTYESAITFLDRQKFDNISEKELNKIVNKTLYILYNK